MKKDNLLLLIVGFILLPTELHGKDSIRTPQPRFFSLTSGHGFVLPTNDFISGKNKIPYATSYTLKYGFKAKGDKWEDHYFGMPYLGLGFYTIDFYRKSDLGVPSSVFLFQGAELSRLSENVSLNYEWNMGLAFNWKGYDPFKNPENTAVGSSTTVHFVGNLYLKWKLSKHFDLNTGVGLAHFSNGATTYPNSGINSPNAFIELRYNFDQSEEVKLNKQKYAKPPFEKRTETDVTFLISSRHAKVDTTGTGLPSKYAARKFKIFGVTYSHMFRNTYRFKWGPSMELTYDESSGFKSWRENHPVTGIGMDRVELGSFGERFSLGLSAKGELVMPHYSVFANLGYNVLHGNKRDKRLYQIIGVKIYLKDNFLGSFAIRSYNFGKAQYFCWNIGYTFTTYKKSK